MGRTRYRCGEAPFSHFLTCTARRIIDYLSERHVRSLLDGLEDHKVRHKTDRPFQLWHEGSQPKMIETEVMLR
jgi:putative transposase